MLREFFRLADRVLPIGTADAHCDIPCGIYDPRDAIQAAQTVIRMTELIQQLGEPKTLEQMNSFSRYVTTKEVHAEKAKHEVLVLWTDYFKPDHLKKWPQLHEKVWMACKTASYTKQHVDMAKAQELKKQLEEIGAIFAESKK
jgi:nickel superoxide dismutase